MLQGRVRKKVNAGYIRPEKRLYSGFQVGRTNRLGNRYNILTMPLRRKNQNTYHHGDLATALLQAVEDLATKFGLEAVSLRACAKALGVSPAAAFKHYADKRALLTAFAAQALTRMAQAMTDRRDQAQAHNKDAFLAVGLGYIEFALRHPAMFQLMWRRDLIHEQDPDFTAARATMQTLLADGFAHSVPDEDPEAMSAQELLA